MLFFSVVFQRCHRRLHLVGQPRSKGKSGKQREQHRHRTQDRNRCHIRSHHAAHHTHRHQRRDNSKGSKDGRVTDFAHRFHRYFLAHVLFHQPVSIDVFDDHNGIIDQNTNRENQREQTHPVDSQSQHHGAEHSEQNNDGDNNKHHQRRPPAQCEPDQQSHDTGSNEQFENQLIDLVVGGGTVIA